MNQTGVAMPFRSSALCVGICCVVQFVCITLLVAGSVLSVDAQIFKAPQAFPAGPNPVAQATGDFNGDGKPDLAVANNSAATVSVLLGNGDGTFAGPVSYVVGNGPAAVVAGDFNGDGKTDLAVANASDGTVSVLLGNGDGTFQGAVNYAATAGASYLMVGDINGDGKLDLLVNDAPLSTTGVQYMSVLLGNGDGTFQAALNYATGGYSHNGFSFYLSATSGMAVGDFNGDGKLDVVFSYRQHDETCTIKPPRCTGHSQAGLQVWPGNGDGTFQTPYVISGSSSLMQLAVADFNGDGKLDLAALENTAVSGTWSTSVLVYLGNGDGSFQSPVTYAAGSGGNTFATSITVGDIDGNGTLDLAISNTQNGVAILFGNGDGTFIPVSVYSAGPAPSQILIGDFNGDGKSDLAVTNGIGSGVVTVLLNKGGGTFPQVPNYPINNQNPIAVAAGDFNGDGKLDLAVANHSSSSPGVSVLLGNGDGSFQSPVLYTLDWAPSSLAVADFNGDHKLDFVSLSESGAWVFLGNGDGTFQTQVSYDGGSNADYQTIAVGDFNGDGKPDLVVTNAYFGDVIVLVGNGDGSFQAPAFYSSGQACFPGCSLSMTTASTAIGDFNGDGKADLAVPDIVSNTVNILLGNGDGTFQAPVPYPVGTQPTAAAVADFNGDGKLDLAVGNTSDSTVSVLLGKGDGTFQTAVTYPVGVGPVGPGAVVTGDFNGDGKMDIAVQGSGLASLLLGNGDGTFRPQDNYAVGQGQGQINSSYPLANLMAAGDFNGDHTLDLAMAGGVVSGPPFVSVAVLLNKSGFFLSVTDAGSGGGGSVTSNPSGIDCGADCSVSFAPGTQVTLTPTPAAGFGFAGWSGACTGVGPCAVTMNAVESVTATFNPVFALSLTDAGNGGGTVTSNPAGINCNSSCSANFFSGTMVMLTAVPTPSSNFAGWSGSCSGNGTCTVTMNAAASVTANFALQDFSLSPTSTTLSVQPGGQGTDVLTLTAVNGPFGNAIQLTCSVAGPAPQPTCALSPSSVTLGTSSATATLTVEAPTTAALRSPFRRHHLSTSFYAVWLSLMFGLTLVMSSKKQRRGPWVHAGFLLLLLFVQTACGNNNATKLPPQMNYTFTVTGASGTIQHNIQIAVTVQ